MGQKSSEEFLLRVKREEDENTNEVPNKNDNKKEDTSADAAAADSGVASSVTGLDTTKPSTANLTSAAVSIPNKVNTNISLTSNLPEQKNNDEVPEQIKPFVTTDQIDRSKGYINETAVLKEIIDTDLNPHSHFNTTIDSHLKTDNLNQSVTDNHKYYMSESARFEKSWIDLKEWNATKHPGIVQEHAMLSKSYR